MTTDEETSPNSLPAPAVDRRAEIMCQMRAEGRSLQSIAEEFALTRERVRQIIRDAGGPGRQDASAARAAKAEHERLNLREQALRLCRERPGSTADDVASALGVTAAEVRAALGDDARRVLISTHRPGVTFEDADILQHLRRAAALAGEPLTVRMYEEVRARVGGASSPLVLQRFGTWREACAHAGVKHGQPLRAHYERRWTRDQLVDAVADYLCCDGARGSFADYERWARGVEGAPSGQTIRTQLGTWSRAKAEALARLGEREDGSDGGDGAPAG